MGNLFKTAMEGLAALLQSKRFLAIVAGCVVVIAKQLGWDIPEERVLEIVAMVASFVYAETHRPVAVKFAWLPGKRKFAANHRRACMKYVQSIGEKYRGTNRYEDAKTELRAKLGEHRTGFAITDVVFAALMQWAVSQLIKWMQDTILDKDNGDDE